MTDFATPNLPSRHFDRTLQFYGALGFEERFRDQGWMILTRGGIQLEFFPHPDLDPLTSWFSCCLRLDDLRTFVDRCMAAGVPRGDRGQPRLHPPRREAGMLVADLVDPDGTLLRLLQSEPN